MDRKLRHQSSAPGERYLESVERHLAHASFGIPGNVEKPTHPEEFNAGFGTPGNVERPAIPDECCVRGRNLAVDR
jgi:hypothetical protein